MKQMMTATVAILMASSASWADVTITSTVSGKGTGAGVQSVTYVKGTKMRTELGENITIHDASNRQMIVLNVKKREAEIYDMAKIGAEMQKNLRGGELRAEITPTGQKKEILGRSCDEYNLMISVPMGQGDQAALTLTMSGPLWLARGAPGSDDYATFYKAAAENGMIFGNPQQARNQAAQMKSTTEMYRRIADLTGVPYEMETQMKFEGSGVLASMMHL
jgi:opacity protein-like surface antigen